MSATCPTDFVERLKRLDSCCVSDAMDRLSLEGSLAGFRRWGPRRLLVGRVRTLLLEPGPGARSGSHLGTRLLATAGLADVVVVANAGRVTAGAWGGLLTVEAGVRGVAGVVIDGGLRDVDEIDRLDVPVFARAPTPRTARGRCHEAGRDVPVLVEGLRIRPGSLVVADGTGVVVIPKDEAERVIGVAEEIALEEARMAEAIRSGGQGIDVMDVRYERLAGE